MDVDRRAALLFGAAAAVRLLLYITFPSLPDLLTGRVEISTPVTSFKRLQEGVFLYTHNVSPYDGGVFHQAPLLLPLFSLLPGPSSSHLPTAFLYTLLDLLSAHSLLQIAASGASTRTRLFTSPRADTRYSPLAVAAAFLFSPFTIVVCVGRPTSAFTNAFVLLATAQAVQGKGTTMVLALSAATYLALHPVLLLPPLLILCYDAQMGPWKPVSAKYQPRASGRAVSFTLQYSALFGLALSTLLFASNLILPANATPRSFLPATYGVHLLLPDLTPNVGLWWYFFIEMFDSFREFFLGVFWLHMASYCPGLCVRLRHQPLFVVATLCGIFAIFQPYPSVADAALYFALVPLFRHVFPLMRYTFFATATLLYATFLGPAFYHLWIYAGSGNANFFYAITLVWSLGLSVIVADLLYAVLRDEWEAERPEVRGKEAIRI
ncbi:GPI transamidase subunit PIG-U family protein [Lineolata rhizophorae]|uniref:GPI transamidase subunit PIG-U family protein n=1 Tax=Lineolata rhizophorae TaxID=578093 RepID=A0A6A6NS18_9PEZI|nr:GPI transamidase subunit PIG-U family protein [Lineolata rhizophorae]